MTILILDGNMALREIMTHSLANILLRLYGRLVTGSFSFISCQVLENVFEVYDWPKGFRAGV